MRQIEELAGSLAEWYQVAVSEADELRASRARLAESAGVERRRIERALHDGVQQDIIAVSVRLQLLRDLVVTDVPAALELLGELQRDTREALTRVRTLANEIYPSLLDVLGLPDALRAVARSAAVDVRVEAAGLGRHPPEIESAVYFCCTSALQSVEPGARVTIRLAECDGGLRLEIDGGGHEATTRDLLAAIGGTVTVQTTTAASVRITATIPLT